MPTCQLSDVYTDVRGFLSDTQVPGGEIFTNSYLPPHFAEPYRTMFSKLAGASKRIQRVIGLVLPPMTSVLIPRTYNILDLSEPEMVEERPAPASVTIATTSATTPIEVNAPSHGLGNTGNIVEGIVSGVANTTAPWGNWFATVVDANNFTLNGSATDNTAGAGGFFYPENEQPWCEVQPIDLTAAGLDGQPEQNLGVYLWINELFQFRGASSATQLRITYYASGTAPTNPNTVIGIDNARDFLAYATAANAARSKGWLEQAELLSNRAYGDPSHPDKDSLIDLFWNAQILASQRGPQRRQFPFRDKRSRWGTYLLG